MAIVGPNGAGKSTILKILSGLYPAGSFSGKLMIEGEEVRFNSPHEAHLKGIGFVPKEINILEDLTVAENIYVNNFNDFSVIIRIYPISFLMIFNHF